VINTIVAAEVRRRMILGHIYAAHPPPHLGGYGSGAGALAIMNCSVKMLPSCCLASISG
jgi:hypothetical protein